MYEKIKTDKGFFNGEKLLAIYTVLSILHTMKDQLGLESMLEYIDNYRFHIEKDNPKLKGAVSKALSITGIDNVYREVKRDEGR